MGRVGARTPGKHGRRSASTAAASAARTPAEHGRAAGTHFGTAARPQIETPIMVQEVSRHSSRHSKDTNLQVQISHGSGPKCPNMAKNSCPTKASTNHKIHQNGST